MLRAYDKATGKEVGAVYMPAPQTGSPMTYMLDGRQYIVIAISGAGYRANCRLTLPGSTGPHAEKIGHDLGHASHLEDLDGGRQPLGLGVGRASRRRGRGLDLPHHVHP